MSRSQRLQSILNQAKRKEKKYDWLEAAELYEQTLHDVEKLEILRKGETQEKIGYCFFRAAFQAETQGEFRKRVGLSVEACEKAVEHFEKSGAPKRQARINFCRGLGSYRKSWLAKDSSERKMLLDKCRKLEKEALKVYEKTGDRLGYGKACNELLVCLYDRLLLAWDWQERKNIMEEAMEYGERAIEALSEIGDEYELARAYCMISHPFFIAESYESVDKQRKMDQKILTYAQKALDISEKVEDSYLISMSYWVIGTNTIWMKGFSESLLRYATKQLELSMRTKDNLIIAKAFSTLALHHSQDVEENPDKRRKGHNKMMQYAEEATTHCRFVSGPTMQGGGYWNLPQRIRISALHLLALDETNRAKKRFLLDQAIEVGNKVLEQARCSGSPDAVGPVLHDLSKAFYFCALVETNTSKKAILLEEASKYREEYINLYSRAYPFYYWDRGHGYNYAALIKAELAKIETDDQKKVDLVRKAVLDMENCLKFCRTAIKIRPQERFSYWFGAYQDWFGSILNQLYLLTGEKRHLERAISVYEDAVQEWGKTDAQTRIAEAHWQMAKLNDILGEHSTAARGFESASERYTLAAEKIPQLKSFYADHALYMRAWNEIEKAKHHHWERHYGQAKERYEKAANLHKSTEGWSYLSTNYLAWARLEGAEDLSRREQTEEARDLFQQAANLFAEAKKSIKAKLETLEASDEKEMAAELVKASDTRREYSRGRIALEEAKILDRQGDHTASSKKYGSATARFQKAVDAVEREADRQELKPIVSLCRAWQTMTRAEAEASPDLYLEASQLFDEAKELSFDEDAKVLALGHSRFCKALEAGVRFEGTRDTTTYTTAKKHIEAATTCYVKAGFKTASEYAKATYRLFDAYIYMNQAQVETDPERKAQFHQMAERLLQASAGSYTKAKHPEKSEEVQRLLENVREERQLAMSLVEVLHAPLIASTTTSFSTPNPMHEKAAGLERFEHAHVLANLFVQPIEAKVGEKVAIEIELVNAGKGSATLVKVENIIPVGFSVIEKPDIYRVEDGYLNLRGKRLDPLKTEDVRIVVQPLSKETYKMKPRILYIDEAGKYKSHEPEPVTITVKELGIKGWIKGER